MANARKDTAFLFEQIERAPLSVLVSRQIRESILSGKISIGTEMPSEKALAAELGVSRSTVREALRILQAQGLLSGGDTVSTARPRVSSSQTLDAAAGAFDSVLRLGRIPFGDLIELRIAIEGAVVEAAAARASSTDLVAAREAIATMKQPNIDARTFRVADLRFHQALAQASGNVAFPLVMNVLRAATSAYLAVAFTHTPDLQSSMADLAREHEAICDAIERHDGPAARALMTQHIRAFYALHVNT